MDEIYNKTNIFCNNCGKSGHLFHQCKLPITSIGIIAIRKGLNGVEILLIRRKNSLGFVDFMRGKYNINNFRYIVNLFNKMSNEERQLILTRDFQYLWKYLWGSNINNQYKNEERVSQEKLNMLKEGGEMKLEVIADDMYFNPWNSDFELKKSKNIIISGKKH